MKPALQEQTQSATNRVAVGALDVEYDEAGEGGRPFVLVHGFTGSRDDFADVLEPLGALGRTLVPDGRGHGGTSNPGSGYTLDQLTADLTGFMDAAGVDRCDLLGHSLGGMVALRFALAHPERLASLVLMDTADRTLGSSRFGGWALRNLVRRLPPRLLWRMVRANRKRLPEPMRRAEQDMGPDLYWNRLLVKLEALDPTVYSDLMREIMGQEPVTDRLGEIRCPTLVLVGDQDERFLGPSRRMAREIPSARLVVIADAHHSPQIEARGAWLGAIGEHLERARGGEGATSAPSR
ncbi:MAG: alpha/beta hydrolase [Candidatus Binatia bacterium]|nr:alpha/beta hydrolase [Candidatus Binatia bacterium]